MRVSEMELVERPQRYSCGFTDINPHSKITTREPSNNVKALFQSLASGPLQRCIIEEVLATIRNGGVKNPLLKDSQRGYDKVCQRGYMTHMLYYHWANGRLEKYRKGRNVYYTLTSKGKIYGVIRGLFK